MSPLTIYTSEGLPKLPLGPQGPQGVQGPQGPAGPQGTPAPVRRYWRLFGDNSGDSTNTNNAVWSTIKSPVFTAPAAGWYKATANFSAGGSNQAALALLVDANVGQMFYGYAIVDYIVVTIVIPLQLTAGQKITIGYRPTQGGKPVTLINSNTVVPLLLVEEVGAPS